MQTTFKNLKTIVTKPNKLNYLKLAFLITYQKGTKIQTYNISMNLTLTISFLISCEMTFLFSSSSASSEDCTTGLNSGKIFPRGHQYTKSAASFKEEKILKYSSLHMKLKYASLRLKLKYSSLHMKLLLKMCHNIYPE